MLWNPQRGTTPTATTIDSFEDQSTSEYSGSTGEFDIVDPTTLGTSWSAPDGTYVLRNQAGQAFSRIYSTSGSGLNSYFSKGNEGKVAVRATATNGEATTLFGLADFNDYYLATVDFDAGELRFEKRVSGTLSTIATDATGTPSADTTGTVTITWDDGTLGGADNDVTLEYAEGGSTIATVSANDSDHSGSSGVGVVGNANDSADLFWDWYRLL